MREGKQSACPTLSDAQLAGSSPHPLLTRAIPTIGGIQWDKTRIEHSQFDSEEQFQHIKEQSERAMMSPSNYIRAAVMRGKLNVILDGKAVARELNAIGNNLNQLTVLANMGQINAVYLEQVHDDLSRLYNKFFALTDKEVSL